MLTKITLTSKLDLCNSQTRSFTAPQENQEKHQFSSLPPMIIFVKYQKRQPVETKQFYCMLAQVQSDSFLHQTETYKTVDSIPKIGNQKVD
jgi:hypothetical protein